MVTTVPGGLDFGTGSAPRLAPGPFKPIFRRQYPS